MNTGFTNVGGREEQQEGNQENIKDSDGHGKEESASSEQQSIKDNEELVF